MEPVLTVAAGVALASGAAFAWFTRGWAARRARFDELARRRGASRRPRRRSLFLPGYSVELTAPGWVLQVAEAWSDGARRAPGAEVSAVPAVEGPPLHVVVATLGDEGSEGAPPRGMTALTLDDPELVGWCAVFADDVRAASVMFDPGLREDLRALRALGPRAALRVQMGPRLVRVFREGGAADVDALERLLDRVLALTARWCASTR